MHQFFVIDENDESRRLHRYLRHIKQLQALAFIRRGLLEGYGFGHNFVQHAGCHPQALVFQYDVDKVKELRQALPGHGRDKEDFGVGHKGQHLADAGRETIHALIVLIGHGVPFVDGDQDAFAPLMGNPGDLRVLIGDALERVDHQHDHIGPFDGGDGADDAVAFELFFYFVFAAQTGGVDKNVVLAVALDDGVDGVARRAGNVGDNDAVFAKQLIYNRRFADVRLADNGDAGPVVLCF